VSYIHTQTSSQECAIAWSQGCNVLAL